MKQDDYITLKIRMKDIDYFSDDIRSIKQKENIGKGLEYENLIYEQIQNDLSETTKLKVNIKPTPLQLFLDVFDICLSNTQINYFFPSVSVIIDDDDNEIVIDAFLLDNGVLKIIEMKKDLLQIDTGSSKNIYNRLKVVKEFLIHKKNIEIEIIPIIVGIENSVSDLNNLYGSFSIFPGEIIIGENFINALGLNYNNIFNKVNKIDNDITNELINTFYKYNNKS